MSDKVLTHNFPEKQQLHFLDLKVLFLKEQYPEISKETTAFHLGGPKSLKCVIARAAPLNVLVRS